MSNNSSKASIDFGYRLVPEGWYTPNQLLEHAVLAEKYGFKTLTVSDHFHPWTHSRAQCSFAWILITAAAERTRNTRLGTFVTAPILRYNPAIIAQAFATLGVLYKDRIFLALGSGEAINEVPVGYEWPSFKERVERLEEAVKVIKMLWTGSFVNFRGKYYRLRSANLYTKPQRPIPLYIAANGPTVAQIAGRYADGFVTTVSPEYASKVLFPALEKGAIDVGRDPSLIDRMTEIVVSYDEDYEMAEEACRYYSGALLPFVYKYAIYDPREVEENAKFIGREILAKKMIIATTPEEHIERIERYLKAGFTSIQFLSASPNEENFIKLYGEKVLAYLRETYEKR